MAGIKKSFKIALTVAWAIYFAAITLSVNFLHHHPTEETSCRNPVTHEVCNHKSHFSKNYSECRICAAHFQKEGEQPSTSSLTTYESPVVRLLIGNKVTGYIFEHIIYLLRGPPSI